MQRNHTPHDSADCSTIAARIYQAIEATEAQQPARGHLGASIIGHHCDRYIWLSFRKAFKSQCKGRILRLFRRGQLEEAPVHADLRAIGYHVTTVDPVTSRQLAFAIGHFAGSCDGIITNLAQDGTPTMLEIKTHSRKSFADLVAKGVAKSKPQHYAQMQVYCQAFDCPQALYFAVNKDTDEIYTELVQHDPIESMRLCAKAQALIADTSPPPRCTDNPTWYQCKMCDANTLCHETKLTTELHCRTCAYSTPTPEGQWHCEHWQAAIPDMAAQMAGCDSHLIHPELTPWPYQVQDSRVIWLTPHGEIDSAKYKSREIVANAQACALNVRAPYEQFGGEIVG